MFYSVAIPGILSPGAIEDTKSETSSRQENAGASVVSQSDWMLPSQERAHASMTTKKSRVASNIDTTAYSGEARALDFAMLYEQLRRPIHSYVYRLLGSQEDADDLTQEVFTRAYVSWNDLYDRENLSPCSTVSPQIYASITCAGVSASPGGRLRAAAVQASTSKIRAKRMHLICPPIVGAYQMLPSEITSGLPWKICRLNTPLCLC